VQVGYGGKLLGSESAVKGIKTFYTAVFVLQVGSHEANVRGKVFEEWTRKGSAQHCDADVWVLVCQ
jgi:hypothetical protein